MIEIKSPVPSERCPVYSKTPSVEDARNTNSSSSQERTELPKGGNTSRDDPLKEGTYTTNGITL